MIFAAHQPNFFPWLGYFQKIVDSDVFVLLDDVQYPRTGGGTYTNRTALLMGDKSSWFTAPINKSGQGLQDNRTVTFHSLAWQDKLLRTLRHQYAKSPCLTELLTWLEEVLDGMQDNLCVFNCGVIRSLVGRLGLSATRIVLSSSLAVEGMQSLRLANLGARLGASVYLSGTGAKDYMDLPLFESFGISVRYQQVRLTPYEQPGVSSFVPGLSILDALANTGFKGTSSLIKATAG